MIDYQCGSCPYGSNDFNELRRHLHQTGHVGIREKDGIKTPTVTEAVKEAEPTEGKSGKDKVLAGVGLGLGFLATTAFGVLAWKHKELLAENEYLKSASGAGATLSNFRWL